MRLPLLAVVALLALSCQGKRRQPNILFIMADDLGWNDVSWNNKAMTTPTLERLASEGIRLDQAYSQQVISALPLRRKHVPLTGKPKCHSNPEHSGLHTVASRFPHWQVPVPHREAEEGLEAAAADGAGPQPDHHGGGAARAWLCHSHGRQVAPG